MSTLIVRALDKNNDWTFGAGLSNYAPQIMAVQQDIQMNLSMFVNDCFFATNQGIDWFNLLGQKNQLAINLAVNAAIINTAGVTGILQTNISLSDTRVLTISYTVNTIYTVLQNTFSYNIGTLSSQNNSVGN